MKIEGFPDEVARAIDFAGIISFAEIPWADHLDTLETYFDGCITAGETAHRIILDHFGGFS